MSPAVRAKRFLILSWNDRDGIDVAVWSEAAGDHVALSAKGLPEDAVSADARPLADASVCATPLSRGEGERSYRLYAGGGARSEMAVSWAERNGLLLCGWIV